MFFLVVTLNSTLERTKFTTAYNRVKVMVAEDYYCFKTYELMSEEIQNGDPRNNNILLAIISKQV